MTDHTDNPEVIDLVYLCGAIDMATDKDRKSWRETARDVLRQHGMSSFSPAHAFTYSGEDKRTAWAMRVINDTAIRESDALIVYIDPNVHTSGTYMEIQQAIEQRKPTVIVTPDPQRVNRMAYLKHTPMMATFESAVTFLKHMQQR